MQNNLTKARFFTLPDGIPASGRNIEHLGEGNRMAARAIALAAGTFVPPHAGPEVFLYVLEGQGRLLAAGDAIELLPGRVVHCPENLVHSLEATTALRLLGVTAAVQSAPG